MKQQRARDKHLLLVYSAADLLLEQGWSALTHRALAARSGVPLASLTYYFDDVDDLLVQAATELARRHLDAARAVVAAVPRRRASAGRTAALVASVLVGDDPSPQDVRTLYERYLRAGRTPALHSLVIGWNTEVHGLVSDALQRVGRPATPTQVRLLVAAFDGLLVSALAEGEPDPVASATAVVTALVPG